MDLLSLHATGLKYIVKLHGREVTLTDLDGNTYTITILWNYADYGIKLDVIEGSPLGAKNSAYIDIDSLNTLGITPDNNWKITGAPNDFETSATYLIHLPPKTDHQLPGMIMFLIPENSSAAEMPMPAI